MGPKVTKQQKVEKNLQLISDEIAEDTRPVVESRQSVTSDKKKDKKKKEVVRWNPQSKYKKAFCLFALRIIVQENVNQHFPKELLYLIVDLIGSEWKFDEEFIRKIVPVPYELSNEDCTLKLMEQNSGYNCFFSRLACPLICQFRADESFEFSIYFEEKELGYWWVACGIYEESKLEDQKTYSTIGHGFYGCACNNGIWRSDELTSKAVEKGVMNWDGDAIVRTVYHGNMKKMTITTYADGKKILSSVKNGKVKLDSFPEKGSVTIESILLKPKIIIRPVVLVYGANNKCHYLTCC